MSEQDETLYIINAVFEYINCARDRYIEYHRQTAAPPSETERSLHYKDIIDNGNSILVKLASSDIEIEYNIAMYIKELQS